MFKKLSKFKLITSIIFLIIMLFLLGLYFGLYNKTYAENNILVEDELPIVYQQGDYRWNYHVHGGGTIGSSACGLLSVTNAVNYLNGNFIPPLELADYAYAIEAYNTKEGGGTWRYVLYRQLDIFEEKYGFKVTNPGQETPLNDACRKHLLNGGAVIALVPGHFIAIVDYNEKTNSYLVLDSAANVTKRHTYQRPTWLSESDLTGGVDAMKIQWHCLLKNDVKKIVHLDGFENESSTCTKACATFTLSYEDRKNNLPVSGYAIDSREIVNYYYTIDYNDERYPLNPYNRHEIIDTDIPYNPDFLGFNGSINTKDLSMGTHYAYITGETKNGGVCTIAEIEIRINKEEPHKVLAINKAHEQLNNIRKKVNTPTGNKILNNNETNKENKNFFCFRE